mmetsp:Transcript_33986/g.95576  ORF Transcript_33986/g.95576 Transcript_33986/m.95576 type:complete len:206 (+) Transcript_33986:628-1245(+)
MIAPGFDDSAASTTSASAWNAGGMCCSARPFTLATSSAYPLSLRKTSAACCHAEWSSATQSVTNRLSSRSAADAPFMAEPMPAFTAPRTKPASPWRSGEAPTSAVPSKAMACVTNSRSLRRVCAACCKSLPSNATAFNTRVLSAWSSCEASASACPRLCSTASQTRSRSPRICAGALASCFQSCIKVIRQHAWRQLFGASDESSW